MLFHPTVPPLSVACVTGCDAHVILSLILCLFGYASTNGLLMRVNSALTRRVQCSWLPAFIHALWVVYVYGAGERKLWGQARKEKRTDTTRSHHQPQTYSMQPSSIVIASVDPYDNSHVHSSVPPPPPEYDPHKMW